MKRQWRTAIVAVVLATLLVVASGPASAQHVTAVSSHTTGNDFNNADTLSNVTIGGQNNAASVQLATRFIDGFEDEPADSGTAEAWKVVNAPNTEAVTTDQAYDGTQSYYLSDSDADINAVRPTHQPLNTASVQNITTAVYVNGTHTANEYAGIRAREGTSDRFHVVMRDGDLQFHNGSWTTITTVPSNNEWVSITVFDIDPSADTVRVKWQTPTDSGVTTALSVSGDMTNGYTATDLRLYGANAFFDTVETGHSANSGQYVSANHSASNVRKGWTNLTLANATATVSWEAHDGQTWVDINSTSYSTDGNKTLDLSGEYDTWRVNVTFENETVNGDPTAKLHDEGVMAKTHPASINNSSLSPNTTSTTVDDVPVTLSAEVSDPDFATGQSDQLNVSFYVDGEYRASDTLTANGTATASVDADAGEHNWHVEVTDEYSHTSQSATAEFAVPDSIEIRDEQNPTELVNNSGNVTVTFYGTASNETYTRTTDDGRINMTGLPANQEFVVFAEVNGWYSRRVLIDSLTAQQYIFLLNSSAATADVTFEIDDQTGQFPSSETRLYIQRSINLTNDTTAQYRVVAGDYFGASEEFPVQLEDGGRYILLVESAEGGTRDLGAYIAEADGSVALSIGEVTFDVGGEDANYRWGTDYNANDGQSSLNATVQFTYNDPTDNTDEICLTVYNRRNESETLTDRCYTGPYGNFSWTEELTKAQENTTWVANWSADRGNEEIGAQRVFGDNQNLLGWSMDPMWEKLLIGLLIVFVAGFFGEGMSRIGAVITAATAAGLWMMGVMPVQVSIILGALAIAVLGRMAQAGGLDSR